VRNTTGDVAAAFHRAHRERYGYAQEQSEIEVVSVRLRSFGLVEQLAERKIAASRQRGKTKPHGNVTAYLQGHKAAVALYRRDELPAGAKLQTPCIVTEYSATTLIPKDADARVDQFGNLLIENLLGVQNHP
jgi:N-methylhydantoinase A